MKIRVACILSCLWATAAHAIPITYHYDGGSFTFSHALVPAAVTGITATFTVDLAPNISASNVPVSSWVISDGNNTIDQSDSDYAMNNSAITDAAGLLVGFYMNLAWDPFNTVNHPVPLGENYVQFFQTGPFGVAQGTGYCASLYPNGTCFEAATAGGTSGATLQAQQVPEPATLSLLGAGLLAFSLRRRRAV